jgi:general secretion pathway protein F
MEFTYKAVDRAGQMQAGSVQAASHAAALNELARMHLMPVRVQLQKTRGWARSLGHSPHLRGHLSTRDVVALTLGLASLLKSGLVLDRALNVLGSTSDRAGIRRLCADLERQVRSGSTFGAALESHARIFPRYYVTMARAGEIGGSLAEGLERLGAFVERAASIRERIVASLIYPAVLAAMILLTLVLVLTVVLPKFKSLFSESQITLPLPTRAVLALGDFVKDYGWICAGVGFVGLIILARAWRDPTLGPRLDLQLLRTRWTFGLIGKTQTSRFLRTVGTLARNGVPLPQATNVALGMLSNRALFAAARDIHERLKQGQDLSRLLDRADVFPKAAVQLARVGEETGRLAELLIEAAETLDREAQSTIDRLLSVLVPGITILMGALVAALIGSVLVGILSLNDLAF